MDDTAAARPTPRRPPRKTKSDANVRHPPPPDMAVCAMFHALGADVGSFPNGYWSAACRRWIEGGGLAEIPRIDFTQQRHAAPSEETRPRKSLEVENPYKLYANIASRYASCPIPVSK